MFVHCGALSVGVRKKLGLPSRFDVRFGNPLDLHALAADFPDVPFIIPHFGAGLFREALLVADLCPNVYLDTSSTNRWMSYHPGLALADVFRQALGVAGPERVLFGTDSSFFPRGWNRAVYDAQVSALRAAGVDDQRLPACSDGQFRPVIPRLKRALTGRLWCYDRNNFIPRPRSGRPELVEQQGERHVL